MDKLYPSAIQSNKPTDEQRVFKLASKKSKNFTRSSLLKGVLTKKYFIYQRN